jgi:hypothetical protein
MGSKNGDPDQKMKSAKKKAKKKSAAMLLYIL